MTYLTSKIKYNSPNIKKFKRCEESLIKFQNEFIPRFEDFGVIKNNLKILDDL